MLFLSAPARLLSLRLPGSWEIRPQLLHSPRRLAPPSSWASRRRLREPAARSPGVRRGSRPRVPRQRPEPQPQRFRPPGPKPRQPHSREIRSRRRSAPCGDASPRANPASCPQGYRTCAAPEIRCCVAQISSCPENASTFCAVQQRRHTAPAPGRGSGVSASLHSGRAHPRSPERLRCRECARLRRRPGRLPAPRSSGSSRATSSLPPLSRPQ